MMPLSLTLSLSQVLMPFLAVTSGCYAGRVVKNKGDQSSSGLRVARRPNSLTRSAPEYHSGVTQSGRAPV